MKDTIIHSIKEVLADRKVLFLSVFVLVASIVYIMYVIFSLHTSDLQLATRYTSYGGTHFYRNKWYYLLSFVGFGVLFAITHVGMIIKLYVSEMKPLAAAFGWLSIIILLLMFSYTYHVLSIAYLS